MCSKKQISPVYFNKKVPVDSRDFKTVDNKIRVF